MLMRKLRFSFLAVIAISIIVLQSCKDDSSLLTKPAVSDQSFSEEFDTARAALNRGWHFINKSQPIGPGVWQQGGGIPPWFQAYSSHGSYVGFIGADYTSTSAGQGVISNWLVSPPVVLQNGDKIIFYTKALVTENPFVTGDSTDWANRLQVAINRYNDGLNVGSGLDMGDFSTVILDINPFYNEYHTASVSSPYAYPAKWTRFEAVVYGLTQPVKGRFAFRYFVEGGGNNGRANGVAVDKVSFVSASHH
ncbi:MAG: hypothetical protein C4308_07355 [Chitinophagaceae bacterium]